jgi:Replication-relaxation
MSDQKRTPKFKRVPEAVASRRITHTSLAVIDTIERYQIIPTSLLVRLVGGNPAVIARHLHQLYHKGLINRFCFMKGRTAGEFHYYLDNPIALEILIDQGGVDPESLDFESVRRNREKRYSDVNDSTQSEDLEGTSRLYLKHESMISRFHGILELASNASAGRVELTDWRQGPELWNRVEVAKTTFRDGYWQQQEATEDLPHRPDAFFTLVFQKEPDLEKKAHFFYEADRKTTNVTRFIKKLRSHFHYIVKQKLYQEHHGVGRIRAVLIETLDTQWAEHLRQAAAHPIVSGKPSSLFWFTASEVLARPTGAGTRQIPLYLSRPEIILDRIWATPVDDTLYQLLD